MKTVSYFFCFALLFTLTGCQSSRYISTAWKNQHAYPGNYNNIIVFAIVNGNDTNTRLTLENHFVGSLELYGYPAISSYKEFGTRLRNLDQEDTYRNLCEKGIDAVITIAWINKDKENGTPYNAYAQPVEYFFNKMWQYKKDQARVPSFTTDSLMKYGWEMILFDLPTLQPHYVAQTKTIRGTLRESMKGEFWLAMIKRLRKDRFLKKRTPVVKTNGPKAF